jgi:hypothetical protein
MKSLFDENTSNDLILRIKNLKPDTKAVWGRMSVSQMLTHAQKPFMVAFDELKLKRGLIGFLFGDMARKKLTGPQPFKKNLPTDKNFVIKDNPNFEMEKEKLINYVQKFAKTGPDGITKLPHPFFGVMTPKEWDTLMYKHLDHHLRQFGN